MINILDISQLQNQENEKDFYVNNLREHILQNKSKITKPHKHNSYLCILFTKGIGTHEIDFNTYEVKPGNIFVISPGKTHHWELSDDVDGFIFTHTKDFYDLHYSHNSISNFPFFQSVQNSPLIELEENPVTEIVALFESMLSEYQNKNILKHQVLVSYSDIIYAKLSRIYLNDETEQIVNHSLYAQKFNELENLIEEHFSVEKSPSKYASMMNITPKHLNRITQSVIGKTTSEVILDRIILEAKRIMLHTGKSFSEIAIGLGYEDYAYFSRLFKQKTGLTPSQFLKSYQ
ncbi:AraC-like DNA-binding protein [Flavobacterium arsenatis]|uniref:AraC-like DNA-binding protein n=1 Tax=Flavobacterium arsenatis TaxID=1484332 RepID=A0ABU1TRU0_9FLAO|nr:helix-turn-helix domain-containing protein [Flavobacterium arsenatis]MDR6968571.1 AraC-like DNA-binding protein [Flavobacterium arsenatis]